MSQSGGRKHSRGILSERANKKNPTQRRASDPFSLKIREKNPSPPLIYTSGCGCPLVSSRRHESQPCLPFWRLMKLSWALLTATIHLKERPSPPHRAPTPPKKERKTCRRKNTSDVHPPSPPFCVHMCIFPGVCMCVHVSHRTEADLGMTRPRGSWHWEAFRLDTSRTRWSTKGGGVR